MNSIISHVLDAGLSMNCNLLPFALAGPQSAMVARFFCSLSSICPISVLAIVTYSDG